MEDTFYSVICLVICIIALVIISMLYLCSNCAIESLERRNQTLQFNIEVIQRKLKELEKLQKQTNLT